MKLKELHESKIIEESAILTGISGILLGLLLVDAIGLNAAANYPEESLWGALKKGRFAGGKLVIEKIKKTLADRKIKKQAENLADDPEVREMIDNNMKGRAFKSGKKNESMVLLNKKLKGSSYDEIRKLLDYVRSRDFEGKK